MWKKILGQGELRCTFIGKIYNLWEICWAPTHKILGNALILEFQHSVSCIIYIPCVVTHMQVRNIVTLHWTCTICKCETLHILFSYWYITIIIIIIISSTGNLCWNYWGHSNINIGHFFLHYSQVSSMY